MADIFLIPAKRSTAARPPVSTLNLKTPLQAEGRAALRATGPCSLLEAARTLWYERVMGVGESPPELIRQMAAGERDAFHIFYDRYAPLVFTLAMRVLKVRSDAEDLLQEVFLQAWHHAENYSQERGSPEGWLTTITRSRAIDKLRSIRRREKSFVASEDPSAVRFEGRVESGASMSEAKILVNSTLARIPAAQRKVLELAYFEGMTQSEVAAHLGEPLGTIKTRMRAAIQSLRELLQDKETEKSS